MTVEIYHKDGKGDVTVTTRENHTVDQSDLVVAWNYDDGMGRVVKFPRENVVKVVVLDDDETAVTNA